MNKIFHIQSSFKALHDEEGVEEVIIEGLASTNHVDRVGDVIELSAWKGGLTNFKTNPVILFNHNADKPIGKALSVRVTERGLELRAKISKIAGDVATLIQEGILGAFSVGFKIKDAEWDDEINGLRIKSAELLEVSVVSVPANQAATFSVAKSFDSDDEYREYIKTFGSVNLAGQSLADDNSASVAPDGLEEAKSQEIEMDPKDIQDLIGTAVKESLAAMEMKRAEEKAAEETAAKLAAQKAAEEEAQKNAISVSVTTAAEKLLEDVSKRFEEKEQNWEQIVAELKNELTERSEEIKHIREQKAIFSDRGGRGDWKEKYERDIVDAAVLGAVTRKGWQTDFGQDILTKVNAHSGVEVPSADFEQLVSTSIERDVELELVLARLFREIPMRSATQILPIMPDADFAQWSTGSFGDTSDAGSAPRGNLDDRGQAGSPNSGIKMTEKILSVNRLVSKSYLGNETEEDAILPVLPLIRESMVRSHARAIEHSILNGGLLAQGGSPGHVGSGTDSISTPWSGLLRLAQTDSKAVDFGESASPATRDAANLLQLRQNMGKYGRRPEDVVFIVSLDYYYGLLEDPEWADVNLVGQSNAVKITGEVGRVYNSPVIVCDEFQVNEVYDAEAVAVNPRNFIIPRLRGFTMESDYIVEDQRRVLVATQRLSFDRIHATAGQVVSGYFAS